MSSCLPRYWCCTTCTATNNRDTGWRAQMGQVKAETRTAQGKTILRNFQVIKKCRIPWWEALVSYSIRYETCSSSIVRSPVSHIYSLIVLGSIKLCISIFKARSSAFTFFHVTLITYEWRKYHTYLFHVCISYGLKLCRIDLFCQSFLATVQFFHINDHISWSSYSVIGLCLGHEI